MTEKALEASSLDELEDVLSNTMVEPAINYSLSIHFPVTASTFVMISKSELGAALHALEISFDPDELRDSQKATIDTSKVSFPIMKKFQTICQSVKSIKFSVASFPMLEELTIEQPNNHPQKIELDLPNLRTLHLDHIYIADSRKFGSSLSKSPKLECFRSYKLWGLGGLPKHVIIAPKLQDWEMQRSDDLKGLVFWAPSLAGIRFKSCSDLQVVHMMDELPPGKWGPEYQFNGEPTKYEVSFYCVDLPSCQGNLIRNKRCADISDDMDDFQIF